MALGAVFVCAIPADNISIPVFICMNENDGYKIPHEWRSVYQKYVLKVYFNLQRNLFVDKLVISW